MMKILFIFISITVLSLASADAAIYKGQEIFIQKCLKCHPSCQDFVAKYKQNEWQKLMENKGKPLAELHLKSKKAKKSWDYFKSKKYYKKLKHLKQFLIEYAKDSGNVPVCN
ncbi:hypothetical protein MNB_SM-6-421 [hydrothermal vent metagenome]|uniref:Cytochrome c domain-containing protein n=1 Tax=hydrothermal vent metagenome TaxID=652676 RepID=A0A1W1CM44_9ZZZZ